MIADACFKAEPDLVEDCGGFKVTLYKKEATPQATPQVEQLLGVVQGEMKRNELMQAIGIKDREYFRSEFLKVALAEGYIEMTDPTKPNSPNQKYKLTDKGRQYQLSLK